MSTYQSGGYDESGGGGSYYAGSYGYGAEYGPPAFLNATGELDGPGSSAYETANVRAYQQTSFAYEGYYGNYYQRDTTTGPDYYQTYTKYSHYANGNYYSSDVKTSYHYGSFGYYQGYSNAYYAHGQIVGSYQVLSNSIEITGATENFQIGTIDQTIYASGGYSTTSGDLSFSDYNGAGVPGSSEQSIQHSYTDAYGYTTTYQPS